MSHVLHNLPLPSRQATISELLRVLKPGGYFLFVEGYRDQQSGARKTQIYFHFLRAVMDSDEGIHHYPTLLRAELEELIHSLGFQHGEVFDFIPMREDFKDKANLDNIARFIDREIEKRSHLPRYEKYRRFGRLLKERMGSGDRARAAADCPHLA
jgi:SAM-dependent methyltransferase